MRRVYLGASDEWVQHRARIRDVVHPPFLDDRLLWPLVVVGVVAATRRRRRDVWIPAVVIVTLIGFFMVTIPHARFRHELIPFLGVYAGAGAVALMQQLSRRTSVSARRSRRSRTAPRATLLSHNADVERTGTEAAVETHP